MQPTQTKYCPDCRVVKEIDDFNRTRARKDGHQPICRACCLIRDRAYRASHVEYLRAYRLANKERQNAGDRARSRPRTLAQYGLTPETFEELLRAQGGRCAVCDYEPVGHNLDVDHCHVTGTVRGLLCRKCNTALGLLGEDPRTIQRAARYVEQGGVAASFTGGVRDAREGT